jgi:CheY-like chemotaxis protein
VKQLVELHGGSVRAESKGLGRGSTFTVVLPFTIVHGYPESEAEPRRPRRALRAEVDVDLEIKGMRVLVVDDEVDARALLKRILEDRRAVVSLAESAEEAIALLQHAKFDVLLADIGMPGEDGYALIRRIRSLGEAWGGNIPAIALTAYARVEDRIDAIAAGFQMHLAKPVEPIEVVTTVAGARGLSVVSPAGVGLGRRPNRGTERTGM